MQQPPHAHTHSNTAQQMSAILVISGKISENRSVQEERFVGQRCGTQERGSASFSLSDVELRVGGGRVSSSIAYSTQKRGNRGRRAIRPSFNGHEDSQDFAFNIFESTLNLEYFSRTLKNVKSASIFWKYWRSFETSLIRQFRGWGYPGGYPACDVWVVCVHYARLEGAPRSIHRGHVWVCTTSEHGSPGAGRHAVKTKSRSEFDSCAA